MLAGAVWQPSNCPCNCTFIHYLGPLFNSKVSCSLAFFCELALWFSFFEPFFFFLKPYLWQWMVNGWAVWAVNTMLFCDRAGLCSHWQLVTAALTYTAYKRRIAGWISRMNSTIVLRGKYFYQNTRLLFIRRAYNGLLKSLLPFLIWHLMTPEFCGQICLLLNKKKPKQKKPLLIASCLV